MMRILERRVRLDVVGASTIFAVLVAAPPPRIAPAPDPDFGPNVTIFDPTTPAVTIQAKLDAVFKTQESSEFGDARIALLFKPGSYDVDARVGFYTQLSGLGPSPDDVVIRGGVRADARWKNGNATLNFWRIAENMSVNPAGGFDRWAVSQAAPMRRMHIRGDLVLDDGGWSSGGFLADSKVDGQVRSGSQQQWLTRNSELGSWTGANWNMVFVGVQNAPRQSFPDPSYTTILSAPVIREKPFLYVDTRGAWKVFVPALRSNTSGPTWSAPEARGFARPISDFVIVKPGSSVAAMNDALARNQNLIITPGIYHLDAPLHVTRANTIVLGLGLATLVADSGTTAIAVDDVDGVIVAGILIEAGATNSPILAQIGPPGSSANHSSNPTLSERRIRSRRWCGCRQSNPVARDQQQQRDRRPPVALAGRSWQWHRLDGKHRRERPGRQWQRRGHVRPVRRTLPGVIRCYGRATAAERTSFRTRCRTTCPVRPIG